MARTWTRAAARSPRALYLSSPIGLGHARRDLAIAEQLRRLHPDLQIDWLTQHPVTRVLEEAGERVHPASRVAAPTSRRTSRHESGEHDLHVVPGHPARWTRSWSTTSWSSTTSSSETPYDLVIGDEAWDVDYFLHENPELKRFSFAWLTDFVGWLPMPDGGEREAAADRRLQRRDARAASPLPADPRPQIFVGNPDDIVDDAVRSGPAERSASGPTRTTTSRATSRASSRRRRRRRQRSRRELGYGPDDVLCVVAVGGSGRRRALLRRVLDAVPAGPARVPALRFLVVTGPRIDPASLAERRRRRAARLRARSLPAAGRVRRRRRPRRADHHAWSWPRRGVPFLYVPLGTTSSRTSTSATACERTARGGACAYDDVSDPECWRRRSSRRSAARSPPRRWRQTGPRAPPRCWRSCCEREGRDRRDHAGLLRGLVRRGSSTGWTAPFTPSWSSAGPPKSAAETRASRRSR